MANLHAISSVFILDVGNIPENLVSLMDIAIIIHIESAIDSCISWRRLLTSHLLTCFKSAGFILGCAHRQHHQHPHQQHPNHHHRHPKGHHQQHEQVFYNALHIVNI